MIHRFLNGETRLSIPQSPYTESIGVRREPGEDVYKRQNLESVLVIYKKALDDRVFRTPVGLEYLRELQGELKAEQDLLGEEIPPDVYKRQPLRLVNKFT